MAVLNLFMVALTIGTKALRGVRGRRTKRSTDKLESALDNSLIAGETHPNLLYLDDREKDLLAILMVEYFSVMSGTEKDRLVRLAEESGLVKSYFDRLGSFNEEDDVVLERITVYGDGTQRRCFCDVAGAVRAIVGLADHPDAPGRVFNVGNTEEVTSRELAERIKQMTGSTRR